jgi:putative hydrolase of the HAD superfamily
MSVRAVIFDVGGVLTTSPFDAFARFEAANGLPPGLLRRLNSTNPDSNAWARLERSEVDLATFAGLYEAEAAALGHTLDGRAVLTCLAGELRPQMLEALRRCHERLKTAALTNNFLGPRGDGDGDGWASPLLDHVDVVVESSRVGLRKPDPAIYRLVCDELGVSPPEAVFLDDLGVNLKPARALGMTTIKVVDPDEAIAELERAVGFPLRDTL